MTRDELAERIRDVAKQSSLWNDIKQGTTDTKCIGFSRELYTLLNKPEHRIEGLELAIVCNIEFPMHTWLIAHHPDTGYVMIDPTIGQFVKQTGTSKAYNDIFIGTFSDLEKLVDGVNYNTDREGPLHLLWSPHARYDDMYPVADKALWQAYEFPVTDIEWGKLKKMTGPQRLGLWAARMEEEGIDWCKLMRFDYEQDVWPDRNKPEQIILYDRIIAERNRHLALGEKQPGKPYQDMLGAEYDSTKPLTR